MATTLPNTGAIIPAMTEAPDQAVNNAAFTAIDAAIASHLADDVTQVGGVHGLVVSSGVWTPRFGGSTTLGATTYTSQTGTYLRIGNLVYITATLRVSNATGGSGYYVVDNLPYSPSAITDKYYVNISQNLPVPAGTIADVSSGKIWLRIANGSSAIAYANLSIPLVVIISGFYRID